MEIKLIRQADKQEFSVLGPQKISDGNERNLLTLAHTCEAAERVGLVQVMIVGTPKGNSLCNAEANKLNVAVAGEHHVLGP